VLFVDKQIWWETPNAQRIPAAITVAVLLGLRFYSTYKSAKNAPKRSPKVRRIERIIAISLWSFIAVGVALLLIFKR
jgi:hypothetical protein